MKPTEKTPIGFGDPPRQSDKSSPWFNHQPLWHYDPEEALLASSLVRHLEIGGTTYITMVRDLPNDAWASVKRKFGPPAVVNDRTSTKVWIWDDGMIRWNSRQTQPNTGQLEIATTDKKVYTRITKPLMALQTRAQENSHVYLVSSNPKKGTSFTRLGDMVHNLERANYAPDVLAGFDRAVKDLRSENPKGRIVLFEGNPGTGKTFLLRGLISSTPANYVIVNPSNFDDLMDPEFIGAAYSNFADQICEAPPAYSNKAGGSGKKPLVLILEDADKLLAPRVKGASLGGLSSALNLGDGLLSGMMDIRIFATTNAEVKEIDEAILRPGRVSERIHVPLLEHEHALSVLKRLTCEAFVDTFPEQVSLATVYAKARELGWEPEKESPGPPNMNIKTPLTALLNGRQSKGFLNWVQRLRQ